MKRLTVVEAGTVLNSPKNMSFLVFVFSLISVPPRLGIVIRCGFQGLLCFQILHNIALKYLVLVGYIIDLPPLPSVF